MLIPCRVSPTEGSNPSVSAIIVFSAPIAQLDRASDYGSEGWGFDSSWVRHLPRLEIESGPFGFLGRTGSRAAAHGPFPTRRHHCSSSLHAFGCLEMVSAKVSCCQSSLGKHSQQLVPHQPSNPPALIQAAETHVEKGAAHAPAPGPSKGTSPLAIDRRSTPTSHPPRSFPSAPVCARHFVCATGTCNGECGAVGSSNRAGDYLSMYRLMSPAMAP